MSLTSRVMLSSERGAETFKPSRDAEKKKRQQKEIKFKKNNPSTSFVEFPTVLLVDNTNNSSVLGFKLLPDLIVHFKAADKRIFSYRNNVTAQHFLVIQMETYSERIQEEA